MCGRISESVDEAIRSRKSVRAFLPTDVPTDRVLALLELAGRAPSGTNIQPWRAYVVRRDAIEAISAQIRASGVLPERAVWDDYRYYPNSLPEPFLGRRRALGAELYGNLGIGHRDISARRAHFMRNFDFFGAPVGIFFSLHRQLETGSYIDLGMLMQNLMTAAKAVGLDTCPQAAFAPYHKLIRPIIGMPDDQVLVCAVALGYEDTAHPANKVQSTRSSISEWVTVIASCS